MRPLRCTWTEPKRLRPLLLSATVCLTLSMALACAARFLQHAYLPRWEQLDAAVVDSVGTATAPQSFEAENFTNQVSMGHSSPPSTSQRVDLCALRSCRIICALSASMDPVCDSSHIDRDSHPSDRVPAFVLLYFDLHQALPKLATPSMYHADLWFVRANIFFAENYRLSSSRCRNML